MNEELKFLHSMDMLFEYLRERKAYFLYSWDGISMSQLEYREGGQYVSFWLINLGSVVSLKCDIGNRIIDQSHVRSVF